MFERAQQKIENNAPIAVFVLIVFLGVWHDVVTVSVLASFLAAGTAMAASGNALWILSIDRDRDFITALALFLLAVVEIFFLLGWVRDSIFALANGENDHLVGLLHLSLVSVSLAGVGLVQISLISSTLRSLTDIEASLLRRRWEIGGFFKSSTQVNVREVVEDGCLSALTSSIYVSSVINHFRSWIRLLRRFL